MNKLVIFISGRGSNMKAILDHINGGLLKNRCEAAAVISNNPDAKGLDTAAEYGIESAVVSSRGISAREYTDNLIFKTASYNPDLIVLAGFMKILQPKFIRAFPGKIINIHPADTSQHQGLHAYEWAFENKLKETFITVHYVDEGVDTGRVIGKIPVDLKGVKTLEEVEKRGLAVEHDFYSRMILKVFLEKYYEKN